MKNKFIKYYMDVAQLTSTLSYATRLQVGAVIVKGHKILATGYNGMPAGWDNNCEDEIGHVLDDVVLNLAKILLCFVLMRHAFIVLN